LWRSRVPADKTNVGFVSDAVAGVDWGAPSVVLAAVAAVLLYVLGGKRQRRSVSYVVSAGLGAAGFLISGWIGVATASMAVSYRIFQSLRAPWQAIITWTAGLTIFTSITLAITALDPASTRERAASGPGGWIDSTVGVTEDVATSLALSVAVLVASVVVTVFVWRKRGLVLASVRTTEGYPPAFFYQGRANPALKTIPEQQRDPRRQFTAAQRREILKKQDGLCAYQTEVREHPQWESFRSGISWETDHIVPHSAGGLTDSPNGQVLCASCNRAKGNTVGVEARQRAARYWASND